MKPIIFYDIPCSTPGVAWSPNTWKTRYCLNYKGLPYETVWVEYPDIEPVLKKLGALPTGEIYGKRYYTLPAIQDPNTNTVLAESILIAEYLDATYPDTPKLFPTGTHPLQHAFVSAFYGKIEAAWDFTIPEAPKMFNEPSREYFERTRKEWFGKPLAEVIPRGKEREEEWGKVKAGMGTVDKWLEMDGGLFMLGNEPGFADFVVVSFVGWFRIMWGAESELWKDFASSCDGRWLERLERFRKWERVL